MATEKLCGVVVGEIGYFNGDCRVCVGVLIINTLYIIINTMRSQTQGTH